MTPWTARPATRPPPSPASATATALAYAGTPHANPADRAMADIAATFAVPQVLLDALLEGFAWDAVARR